MSHPPDHFEYDIAFSFHSKDEGTATALNDLLQDRVKTFIYSARQKEIAGTDGQESFSAVYGEKARLVVVFYREEWGQTPFTRIEMDAIKNRSLQDGWDFTVFIPTEMPAKMPAWVPKTRLYVGLERWGLTGAASVVEERLRERGGEPKVESLTDRAARFSRATKLKEQQRQFLNSDHGVKAATDAYAVLTTALEEGCKAIGEAEPSISLRVQTSQQFRIVNGYGPVHLIVSWRPHYANSLEEIFLQAEYYKGFPKGIPGFYGSFNEARQLRNLKFRYELLSSDRHGYVDNKSPRRDFSAAELGEHLLRNFLDLADKHHRDR
ncbi:hypothetical protein [Kumtagia ephedrae]|uniref:TIR domain-containing protein n=1 Tax=Kumtagia ephedrae TaxID=2116701 RepID=A0A2P7SD85_9HYPH|nr:hypothetical protein [Mesorhizobium ephedrae]PSJ60472.1 hypothetical protein C7I84_10815 [Mesorhizobium ephedrae]